MIFLIDSMGWIGSVTLIAAYLLNSINRLDSQSFLYQFMNFFGAFLLIINTIYYGAYPSGFLNLVWGIIAGAYLLRMQKQPANVGI